ncbi:hypothetical protein EW145_g3252 [Phellinidium pouzarii]|uniref:DNA recombination and repair protein Rad51-like C-terminal domain-containing protein n=1 Tax=Phellinidium pouzarii TaxID=167371 RepID=A0A4S4L9Q1_9AGAM|nr:hypothetical protein EW145_g3252 [Phellinidium pouzarii]
MLDEIQSETASQMMNSILYQTSPPGSTGLPGLDAHLLFSTPHHSSATSSLNRGDFIEIQGPAASGKTQLVYHLTMKCILPQEVILTFVDDSMHLPHKVDAGGWCKAAVIIDTDGRWNVQRLKCLLVKHLEKAIIPISNGEFHPSLQELVIQSLKRVHMFRPTSSVSLAATILRLPAYHTEHMPSLEIALLVIDSISSFYWLDRYAFEQQRYSASNNKKDGVSPLNRILVALQDFRLSHGPVIALTNWGLTPVSNTSVSANPGVSQVDSAASVPTPFYRQHLHPFPAPFEVPPRILPNPRLFPPITHHITLPSPQALDIPSGGTADLKEARAFETRSPAAVDKYEFTGILRTTVEGSTASVFNFYIREDGITG